MNEILDALVQRAPGLNECAADIHAAFELVAATYRNDGKLLI